MSNSTAIKDVTRGLQQLLISQLSPISSAAQVSLLPPGQPLPSGLGVNLYLYRVMESPFTKNEPWPGDRKTPPSDSPALGVELSYLLTPFAPAPDPSTTTGDDAHTMLGAAMLALHQYPILNNVHTKGFDADTVLPADVLNSFEQIKIRLAVTSLEELSKIWATINQPYRLSVAYEVSLVELVPNVPLPIDGGKVLSTGVNVIGWQAPRLDALLPPTGALAHVDANGLVIPNLLTIQGSGFTLPGQLPIVLVGGQPATISKVPPLTDSTLAVVLPSTFDAGPNENVQVTLKGKPSAPLAFTASPWLSLLAPIRTALAPGPPAPTLVLRGNGFTTTPQAVRLNGPGGTTNVSAFVGPVTDSQATITIPSNLQNGVYQVRMILAAPANNASNARTLEIIPLVATIGSAVLTVSGNQVHQLTLNGARLDGTDVSLLIDGVAYRAGANANANQLVFTLGRLLDPGQYGVAVVVNGSRSHDIVLGVT
jgi:Pvc16 N-terminal domain/IPT/TIG domain